MKGQKTKERKQLEKTPRLCSHYTWQLLCRHSMNSNSPGEHKSFTHIEHRAGTVGREGLVHSIPVLTPEYLLPSWWVPVLTSTYLLPWWAEKVFTTHQSMAENLSNICFSYSTFEIDEAHNHSCVWTEALSGLLFKATQKLFRRVWTKP